MNSLLLLAAVLNAICSLLHVLIIFGGAAWYRFFGAGERMANAAASGEWYPAVITSGIAAVLMMWAAYALSGAGVIPPLPFIRTCLGIITVIFLCRGFAVVPLFLFARAKVNGFMAWSSLICIAIGFVHLSGLMQVWAQF
ncbi:hypothetical protein [Undibacterium sp.]|uniref:hypothetical protein n=1 Tax=Undibacterium sp. TaxID=1914977 RepID=UPI002C2E1B25|nr:hypothetical protein [Undibacterium sp.]HTD05844.1 hypothetical protein [Undibacterium sp.]